MSLLPYAEAQERILQGIEPLAAEPVAVADALGRTLAASFMALRTLPPWDNSAMDGYAVRSGDTGAAPVRLKVTQTVYAGQVSDQPVSKGECARIMTGGPIPPGADAVLMQERTRRAPVDAEEVELLEPVVRASCIRKKGEDARAGEELLSKGTLLGIPELGLLWAQGATRVDAPRRPRVAVLSTGDELCLVGAPGHGRIVDTNGPSLALAVEHAGGIPTYLGIAHDARDAVTEKLRTAGEFDVVLTSAGVSVGDHDCVREALLSLGVELDFWGVAIKPGKPLAFGRRDKTFFFGLPGNPTSSLVTFELFVRPAIRRLLGVASPLPSLVGGRSAVELTKSQGLANFIRVSTVWKEGELWAYPLASQTSGAVRSAVGATHLLHFPRDARTLAVGQAIELVCVDWSG